MLTGVKIGDYHSFDDLGMLLATRDIEAPGVQTYTVEVPGRNGLLDLTDAINDEPRYENRTISLEFVTTEILSQQEWPIFISNIGNLFHGQKLTIVFDEDLEYYYYGRVSVNSFKTDCFKQTVTLECDCEPYKYYAEETVIEVASPTTVTLPCDRMPVVPTLVTDAEITIVCGSLTTTLSAGTWTMTALPLSQGGAEWEISGEANVTITYRQGRL